MNIDEVNLYFDTMMQLWTNPDDEVGIDEVNRSLANWHAVGVYLSQKSRELESLLFAAERDYETKHATLFRECRGKVGERAPQKEVEALINIEYGATIWELRESVAECNRNLDNLKHLKRIHEKYPSILNTLSNNMRTDFMYSGQGDSPKGEGFRGSQAGYQANARSMGSRDLAEEAKDVFGQ